MVVLNVQLDNFYAFKNFKLNLTYPKKIVGSCIKDEHLENRPNFRYKKVNIITGANASGKTTFGHMLMNIFNFLVRKNYEMVTDAIGDKTKQASFLIDLACSENNFYRVKCVIPPCENEKYEPEDIALQIQNQYITTSDSYESCIKKLEDEFIPNDNYLEEIKKITNLDWMFQYPNDSTRILNFPKNDNKFLHVLEYILKALDPAIKAVVQSREVKDTYIVRYEGRDVILQDDEEFDTNFLSSGTKSGVEVAPILSSLLQKRNSFFYCDEKFTYVHSDIEKAVISLMIDLLHPNDQLFFTTHNMDILDMNLPKHSFLFLKKEPKNIECPITCVDASSMLKRGTDSLRNAVENDMFSCAPSVDMIYDIANM